MNRTPMRGDAISRRQALAALFGACGLLPSILRAAESEKPVRLAISEAIVVDVNLNDARVAMQLWLKRIMEDLKVVIEISPKVFDNTEEILRRVRAGQLDAVALNIVEFRQIADFLDSTELLVGAGASGPDQYLLLVNRKSGVHHLNDLRKKRLCLSKAPKMCVAPAWLTTLLDEERLGPADEFFGSITSDTKVARVVLPVFFGQADACITSKRAFETMCEMNPQVGRDLTAIATSASMVVAFYTFRKGYHEPSRQKFIDLHSTLLNSSAGRQLATLFQFDELTVRDASCLTGALSVLDRAEKGRLAQGGRKG